MKSVFCCPVCRRPLERNEILYRCSAGHTFDVSKKGYVNLLLNNSSGSHGDNKEMLSARRHFLNGGHYAFLADAVSELLTESIAKNGIVLDVGCGEGYYTERFYNALFEKKATVAGTDISKAALSLANGKRLGIEYAVATNAKLPLSDGSVDAVTALFTPFPSEEIRRVLKPDGFFIHAIPDVNHLMGLKRALYETPYANEIAELPSSVFRAERKLHLKRSVALCGEDAKHLFRMTPYYYKTSKEAQEAFDTLPVLTTEFSFVVTLYRPVNTAR